ncbi:MAG: hypothetical protein NXI08_16705, partial [bacterium]|nr:hypothetical protein [bacterium]
NFCVRQGWQRRGTMIVIMTVFILIITLTVIIIITFIIIMAASRHHRPLAIIQNTGLHPYHHYHHLLWDSICNAQDARMIAIMTVLILNIIIFTIIIISWGLGNAEGATKVDIISVTILIIIITLIIIMVASSSPFIIMVVIIISFLFLAIYISIVALGIVGNAEGAMMTVILTF